MSKNIIAKRTVITNDIIKELDTKYPITNEKNGIAYNRDLKYITFQPNFDFTADIVAYDIEIGFGSFNVIIYFAEQMAKDGYRVRVDGNNLMRHLYICAGTYGVPSEKSSQIVAHLIRIGYFFRITDGTYEYLTTTQAVFDFERCMNTRLEERRRKAKSREKLKKALENTETPIVQIPKLYEETHVTLQNDESTDVLQSCYENISPEEYEYYSHSNDEKIIDDYYSDEGFPISSITWEEAETMDSIIGIPISS